MSDPSGLASSSVGEDFPKEQEKYMTFRVFARDRLLYEGGFPGLACRVLWTMFPSVVSCALFWWIALGRPIVSLIQFTPSDDAPKREPASNFVLWLCLASALTFLAGASMNAVVTLANGGFMPVGQTDVHTALWVTSSTAHHLLFLGDNYGGFSLGDFVLMGGLLLLGLSRACDRRPKLVAEPTAKPPRHFHRVTRVVMGSAAFLFSPSFVDAPFSIGLLVLVSFAIYVMTLHTEWRFQERERLIQEARARVDREGSYEAYHALVTLEYECGVRG